MPNTKSKLLLGSVVGAMLASAVPVLAQYVDPHDKANPTLSQGLDPVAEQVVAADSQRVAAWQRKDWKAMEPLISEDIHAFSVTVLPHSVSGKAAFMDWAAKQDFSKALAFRKFPNTDPDNLNNHQAWIIGSDKSVAILAGVLADPANPKDKGRTYIAVYHKANNQWQLLRYQMTVNGASGAWEGQTERPPGTSDTVDLSKLPAEGQQVADKLTFWHDSLARRIQKNFLYIFSDWSLFDRGDIGFSKERPSSGVLESGYDYINGKHADSSGAPEIVIKTNPIALVLGKSRDVVVLNDVRADATGGSAGWGLNYAPQWRNWMDELSVWQRSGDQWRMTVFASGQYYKVAVPSE